MPGHAKHIHLDGSGAEHRKLAGRLSELSLVALEEIARAFRRPTTAESGESVAGMDLNMVRVVLDDVSGSLWLPNLLSRCPNAVEDSEQQSERSELAAGILQALTEERTADVETMIDMTLTRYPADYNVTLTVGFVRWVEGSLGDASRLFAQAASQASGGESKADALFLQAMVARDGGDLDGAISALDLVAEVEDSVQVSPCSTPGRAHYEQARLLGRHLGDTPTAEQAERWRSAVRAAVDADAIFFGPAFVDPEINRLTEVRSELRDRFNSISIDANLLANAGDAFVRVLQNSRVLDYEALRPARDAFRLQGYLSRSRLGASAIDTVVQLRAAAAAILGERITRAHETRDAAVSLAEQGRQRGVEAADKHLIDGEAKTQALDIQALTLRQTMSGRFRLDIALDLQFRAMVDEADTTMKNALIFLVVCVVVLSAGAAVLVPTWIAKITAVLVLVSAATALALWSRSKHQIEVRRLQEELQCARNVQMLEQNIVFTAQESEVQSQQIRTQAEGSRQAQLEAAMRSFETERAGISQAIAVLASASKRFFQAIDKEDDPRASFEPPTSET